MLINEFEWERMNEAGTGIAKQFYIVSRSLFGLCRAAYQNVNYISIKQYVLNTLYSWTLHTHTHSLTEQKNRQRAIMKFT